MEDGAVAAEGGGQVDFFGEGGGGVGSGRVRREESVDWEREVGL